MAAAMSVSLLADFRVFLGCLKMNICTETTMCVQNMINRWNCFFLTSFGQTKPRLVWATVLGSKLDLSSFLVAHFWYFKSN